VLLTITCQDKSSIEYSVYQTFTKSDTETKRQRNKVETSPETGIFNRWDVSVNNELMMTNFVIRLFVNRVFGFSNCLDIPKHEHSKYELRNYDYPPRIDMIVLGIVKLITTV